MNSNLKYIIGSIILIVIFFFIGRCTKECDIVTKEITVTTPEVKGDFDTPKVLVPESNTIKTIIKFRDTTLIMPQVNQELVEKYLALQNENDATKRENASLKMYTDAVTINNYNTPFEDDNIKLTIKAKTQGLLLEAKPDYTIKPKTITTNVNIPKEKQKVFSLNAGLQLASTKELSKFDPAVKLDLVGKKNILSASYSKDGYISVGYTIPLFSIKK